MHPLFRVAGGCLVVVGAACGGTRSGGAEPSPVIASVHTSAPAAADVPNADLRIETRSPSAEAVCGAATIHDWSRPLAERGLDPSAHPQGGDAKCEVGNAHRDPSLTMFEKVGRGFEAQGSGPTLRAARLLFTRDPADDVAFGEWKCWLVVQSPAGWGSSFLDWPCDARVGPKPMLGAVLRFEIANDELVLRVKDDDQSGGSAIIETRCRAHAAEVRCAKTVELQPPR